MVISRDRESSEKSKELLHTPKFFYFLAKSISTMFVITKSSKGSLQSESKHSRNMWSGLVHWTLQVTFLLSQFFLPPWKRNSLYQVWSAKDHISKSTRVKISIVWFWLNTKNHKKLGKSGTDGFNTTAKFIK